METKENMHFLDYVVDGMRKSADELEKFQLQASLGKMEALEKYDELKKYYTLTVHDVKSKIEHGKEQLQNLQAKVQDLQVQFALGKADTLEMYEEQKKKILLAIHEIEVTIKTNPTFIKTYALLLETLEKIKVKLEILSTQLDPLKEKVSTAYEARKKDIEDIISSFREKLNKETDIEHRMDVFQDELALAYKHLKKAFVQA